MGNNDGGEVYTPAITIQERFDEIYKLLSGKKAKWERIGEITRTALSTLSEEYGKMLESPATSGVQLNRGIWELAFMLLMTEIVQLGLDISETHERLAKVEKEVKQLRLGRK